MSAKINLKPTSQQKKHTFAPQVTIDGYQYFKGDYREHLDNPIESITVSRVLKYESQKPSENAKYTINRGIIAAYEDFEQDDGAEKNLTLEKATALMQIVLKTAQLSDVPTADFADWFNKLAKKRNHEGKKVIQLSTDGEFKELFEMCSRRRS